MTDKPMDAYTQAALDYSVGMQEASEAALRRMGWTPPPPRQQPRDIPSHVISATDGH